MPAMASQILWWYDLVLATSVKPASQFWFREILIFWLILAQDGIIIECI